MARISGIDRMKIAIDARMLLPEMTGVGRYLLGLSRALSTLDEDCSFELWLQPELPREHPVWDLQGSGLKLHRLPAGPMDYRQQWVLPAEVRRRKPDVLHYPHFDLPLTVPGPVVATIHDLKYIARPEFFPNLSRIKSLLVKALMSFTVRRAQGVIAVSHSTRQDLVHYLSADPGKIAVIHEGVAEQFFRPPASGEMETWLRRLGLTRPFLLFVGERRPHKNIPGLLRAFQHFSTKSGGPHHLVIVGKSYGGYREPEKLVDELRLAEKVHFLEGVSDRELTYLYYGAQAFVSLSFYEGFGLPVLEAMACGVPVVAADTPAFREVVGDAGLLVEAGSPEQAAEALCQVVASGETCVDGTRDKRAVLVARGLRRARRFTWEACARQTMQVYREAVEAWQ